MPNSISATGLQVATRAELVDFYTSSYQTIYGADINLASDTPDGQMMNIYIQSLLDLEELLMQIYNSFDPDNAIGAVLDQRVAINGIQRQAGTYSTTDISIVTNQALNLYGLDQVDQAVYTVQDNAGTKWQLLETQNVASPLTFLASFRAALPGASLTTQNTITIPVTIVLGVVSVNNPTQQTSVGLNEETDAVLKVRRQKSVSLASQGYLKGLLAALENINGVTSAFVYENNTSGDVDGVPGHSIWVIVAGTAEDELIANAIYTKRNAGCGMFGSIDYTIIQVDGSPFTVRWDVVTTEDLYIKFTVSSIDGVNPPALETIREQLPLKFIPGVFETVNINDLATIVQEIDPNTLVTNAGFGLTSGGSFTPILSPSAKNKQFVISSANIIITPLTISPATLKIAHLNTRQFVAFGGYGTYVFTLDTNNSGATITSDGVYTAGSTFPTSDVVKVTDGLGNTALATVTVI